MARSLDELAHALALELFEGVPEDPEVSEMTSEPVAGPWFIESRAGAVRKWGVYALPRGRRQNVASFIPNEATAQLIAAAPGLLGACRDAILALRHPSVTESERATILQLLEAATAQLAGGDRGPERT